MTLPTSPPPPRRLTLGGRMPAVATLAAAVLLAHAWLLGALPVGLGSAGRAAGRPLVVRQIVVPASTANVPSNLTANTSAAPPALAAAARPVGPPRVRAQRPSARPAEAPEPTVVAVVPTDAVAGPIADATATTTADPFIRPSANDPASNPLPLPALSQASAPEPAPARPDPVAAVAAPSLAPAAGAAGEVPPTYATRLPPAAVLRYELRRGLLTGQGELSWRPGPDGYEMQIEGTAFGMSVLAWIRHGGVDSAGLAPLRFVDRRRGRDVRAANFQRDKGLITWSSTPAQQPLLAGAQDRLSWMVQLAAIVEADPGRFVAGQRVPMLVAGARGDADIWTFTVNGVEAVDVVGARIDGVLALRREPRKPFDTQVEVWLDPLRHHLPVRLKLSTAGGADSMEFVLKP